MPAACIWSIGLCTDNAGNMIATGYFSCTTDFNPVGTGGVISATPGNEDIFLVKYNNQGQFQWVKSMGGAQRDIGYAVDCDEKGQIYLTGHFQGVIDLDTGLSSASYSSVGLEDAFVAKYDTNRAYVWSFQLGGTEREYGHGISVGHGD